MSRRELTPAELEAAANARQFWLEKKRTERLTQDDAAFALSMTTSGFSQYINGKIPLNTDATKRFADYFGVSPTDIDKGWLGGTDALSTLNMVMESQIEDSPALQAVRNLRGKMTPRSKRALDKIEEAAKEGRLEKQDEDILEALAKRYE